MPINREQIQVYNALKQTLAQQLPSAKISFELFKILINLFRDQDEYIYVLLLGVADEWALFLAINRRIISLQWICPPEILPAEIGKSLPTVQRVKDFLDKTHRMFDAENVEEYENDVEEYEKDEEELEGADEEHGASEEDEEDEEEDEEDEDAQQILSESRLNEILNPNIPLPPSALRANNSFASTPRTSVSTSLGGEHEHEHTDDKKSVATPLPSPRPPRKNSSVIFSEITDIYPYTIDESSSEEEAEEDEDFTQKKSNFAKAKPWC